MTLLSVVIPTCNRTNYALACITNLLARNDADLEVVVQDSSDTDELRSALPVPTSTRLVYNFSAGRISMSENFDRGATAAGGEYVAFIGDDDGMCRQVVDVARFAQRNGIDCVTPRSLAHYYWPDFQSRFSGRRHAGKLYIKRHSGAITPVDTRSELRHALRKAAQRLFDAPKVYYGIVRRSLLEAVRQKTGSYFDSSSPDVWGVVCVSLLARSAVIIDSPLFVPGASSGSKAGSSAMREHMGDLDSVTHISRQVVATWPARVPKFFSVETVWAEAALRALNAMGARDLLETFNFAYLYARCFTQYPKYSSATVRAMRAGQRPITREGIAVAQNVAVTAAERGSYYFRRIFQRNAIPDSEAFAGVLTISQAVSLVEERLVRDAEGASPVNEYKRPTNEETGD